MLTSRPHDHEANLHWLRSAVDLIASFIVAIIILRGLILEGYLISTGSMAPGLLGFHRRVVCPTCHFTFAFGISFDDSVDPTDLATLDDSGSQRLATCPNCGQTHIEVDNVPASHGDQLLVQKHVYDFRRPRRWETIVFRNPASPGEAYVKRVTGLPGESIQIIDGDIYINGQLARKDFRTQREMRILVADLHHLADSPRWEMPWLLDDAWMIEAGTLQMQADSHAGTIQFRPWRWSGGEHPVETPLNAEDAGEDWAAFLERFDRLPLSWACRIEYDEERSVLRCEGVMPETLQNDLVAQSASAAFRSAVYRLAALSHLAAVTDGYGYNALVSSQEYPVRDLMLSTSLSWSTCPDEIRVDVPLDSETRVVRLFPGSGEAQLCAEDAVEPLRRGHFETGSAADQDADSVSGLTIDISNFDRQIVVAVNGVPVFDPWQAEMEAPEVTPSGEGSQQSAGLAAALSGQIVPAPATPDGSAQRDAAEAALGWQRQNRWKMTIAGSGVRVQQLQMSRDVYYTPGRRRHGVDSPCVVDADSYFVQGDNSPVSSDSRSWKNPCVPHKMLLGKPFLLHLPSRPALIQLGDHRWPIRIPDWSRIRYIH